MNVNNVASNCILVMEDGETGEILRTSCMTIGDISHVMGCSMTCDDDDCGLAYFRDQMDTRGYAVVTVEEDNGQLTTYRACQVTFA